MKRLILLLFILIPFLGHSQDVSGDELRIYQGASIGEDGTIYPLDVNGNRVVSVADPIDLLDAVNKQWFMANMSLTQPVDSLSLKPLNESSVLDEYTFFADTLSYGASLRTGLGSYIYKLGQATVLLYYNDNAYTIDPFDVVHLKGGTLVDGQLYPTPELADASDWEKTQGTLSVAAHSIAPNSFGFTVIYGVIKGGSTIGLTAGEQIWLSDDGTGDLTTTRPEFQSYAISIGGVFNTVAAPDGQIFVNITRDIYDTFNDGWDGAIRETFDFMTSSDGVTITGTLENVVTANDLTLIFSDGFYTFDTTPAATVTLIAGSATSPQINYVFIDKATKTLQTSTGSFPVTEHAKVAIVVVLDAVSTQTQGALRNQNTNDHIKKEGDNGHILHIAERIRQFNADWDSGVESTLNGTPSDVYIANTSGKVWQMHLQDFESQDMSTGDDIHVVNDPTTAYRITNNLNDITAYSSGDSWNNQWSNIVVWGVCNKSGQTSHLMVNLPSNGYLSEEDAFNDNENYTNYTIPKIFRGVGFLIGRFTIRRSSSTFTYNIATGYLDLRGFVPNNTAGAGGGGASGITTFLALTDVPNSYTGFSGQAATVTALEDGLEFSPVVTSINGISPTLGNYNEVLSSVKVGEDVVIMPQGTGIGTTFSVADNDNSTSNELQDLGNSKLNNDITVTISSGTNTTITDVARTGGYLNSSLNASSIQTGGVERIDASGSFSGGSGSFSGDINAGSLIKLENSISLQGRATTLNFGNLIAMGTDDFAQVGNSGVTEGVQLYFKGNLKKLETSASGIDVTGNVVASGTVTAPTSKLTTGAVVDKVWTCTNVDGSGAWDDAAGTSLTLQDVTTNGNTTSDIVRIIGNGSGLEMITNDVAGDAPIDLTIGATSRSAIKLESTTSPNLTSDYIDVDIANTTGSGNFIDLSSGGVSRFSVNLLGHTSIGNVLKLTPTASAPSSPSLGWIYVNSTDNHMYFYNGTTWVQLD